MASDNFSLFEIIVYASAHFFIKTAINLKMAAIMRSVSSSSTNYKRISEILEANYSKSYSGCRTPVKKSKYCSA